MRTLELNKTTLWYVEANGVEDILDSDGYDTGEIRTLYTEPKQIHLHLYPATSKFMRETFGEHHDVDIVTTTTEELDKSTLLFTEKPTGDFATTYDYRLDGISKSLNYTQYGFKGGV